MTISTEIDEWKADLHRRIALAKRTKCPDCKTIGFQMQSHPATGIMCNCSCGVRSGLDDWIAGVPTLRRDPGKHTYSYTPEARAMAGIPAPVAPLNKGNARQRPGIGGDADAPRKVAVRRLAGPR